LKRSQWNISNISSAWRLERSRAAGLVARARY
jgi:hypothetical protein